MKCETQPFDIEAKVRQDCYNRGYEQGRKNPAEEIVKSRRVNFSTKAFEKS